MTTTYTSLIKGDIAVIEQCQITNSHGVVVFIDVKHLVSSSEISDSLPECCVTVKIQLEKDEIISCTFYNPPEKSPYRYSLDDFKMISKILKQNSTKPCLLCGDLNFPETNWELYQSSNTYESEVLEMEKS